MAPELQSSDSFIAGASRDTRKNAGPEAHPLTSEPGTTPRQVTMHGEPAVEVNAVKNCTSYYSI